MRLTFLLILLWSQSAVAALIHVPGDVHDIQNALQAAESGDTVLVSPGTYYENIIWPERDGIALLSTEGAAQTIIDGEGIAQVIGVYSAVDSSTVIAGFTLTDGRSEGQ